MSGVEEQGAAQQGGAEDSIKVICRLVALPFSQSFNPSFIHHSARVLATALVTVLVNNPVTI